MSGGSIDLGFWNLAAAYIFTLILLLIVRIRKINREKLILIAAFRMSLQLVITGYLLMYVFRYPNPFITVLIVAVMTSFAYFNVKKRCSFPLSKKLKGAIALSLCFGTLPCLVFFIVCVIGAKPWFHPQYFIPVAGMIVGNSMTGVSLGVNRLCADMAGKRDIIENSLMLGAAPKDAVHPIANDAFDSAILPTINQMVGMGIVSLPGMMTGQILAGTLPLTAIKYQIAIMLGISGSVSVTVLLFVSFGARAFFNSQDQLVLHEKQ